MNRSTELLNSIYITLQDLEVKGEKNCSIIVGVSNAIKQYLKEISEQENQ